jgi:hypothetical protein
VAYSIHIFLGGLAFLFSGRYDVVTVLVCTCQEIGLCAAKAMKPIEDISHNCGIGMSEMGFAIDIIYRGGDVKLSGQL